MRKVTVEVTDPNKYISAISVIQNTDIVMLYIDATAVGKRKIQDCMFEDKNWISIFNVDTKISTMIKVKNLPFRKPIIHTSWGRYSLFVYYHRRESIGKQIVYHNLED